MKYWLLILLFPFAASAQYQPLVGGSTDSATLSTRIGTANVVQTVRDGSFAGQWYWSASSTATPSATVVQVTGVSTGRWLKIAGGNGTGSPNTSVGGGYVIAKSGSNVVRTLIPGFGFQIDSASNTLNLYVDSNRVVPVPLTLITGGNLRYTPQGWQTGLTTLSEILDNDNCYNSNGYQICITANGVQITDTATGARNFVFGTNGIRNDYLSDGTGVARMLTVTNGVFGYQNIPSSGTSSTSGKVYPGVGLYQQNDSTLGFNKAYTDGFYPRLSLFYDDPAWINSLSYGKLTGTPTALSQFTNDAGYIKNITGLLQAGSNTTVTGNGTTGSPYVINGVAAGATYYAQAPLYKPNDSTFAITQAGSATNGYLSSTDWNTFNNKQDAGSGVTSFASRTGVVIPQKTDYSNYYLGNTGDQTLTEDGDVRFRINQTSANNSGIAFTLNNVGKFQQYMNSTGTALTVRSDAVGIGDILSMNQNSGASMFYKRVVIDSIYTGSNRLLLDSVSIKMVAPNYFLPASGVYDIIAIGDRALQNNTSNRNIAIGSKVLSSNTLGNQNTGIGSYALRQNTTGYDNVAVGYTSLDSNTTGCCNTGLGNYSLRNNTTGSRNTAIGETSLLFNKTGINNTSVGYGSSYYSGTGSYNIAIGQAAMSGLSASNPISGSYNLSIGNSTLLNLTTGSNNIALGYQAGNQDSSGSQNVYIGSQSGSLNPTGSGNVFIGYQSGRFLTNISNRLCINNSSTGSPLIYGEFDNRIMKINGQLQLAASVASDASSDSVLLKRTSDGAVVTRPLSYFSSGGSVGGSIPTLQQVSDAGSRITDGITTTTLDASGTLAYNSTDFSTATSTVSLGPGVGVYSISLSDGIEDKAASLSYKGILYPSYTTSERDALLYQLSLGQHIYNTDTEQDEVWDGTQWKAVGGSGGDMQPLTAGRGLNGNAYTGVSPVTWSMDTANSYTWNPQILSATTGPQLTLNSGTKSAKFSVNNGTGNLTIDTENPFATTTINGSLISNSLQTVFSITGKGGIRTSADIQASNFYAVGGSTTESTGGIGSLGGIGSSNFRNYFGGGVTSQTLITNNSYASGLFANNYVTTNGTNPIITSVAIKAPVVTGTGGTNVNLLYLEGIASGGTTGNYAIWSNSTSPSRFDGSVQITAGSPGVGKVFTSDANGLGSWQTPASGSGGGITTESDPTVPSYVKSITTTEKDNWNTAYGWGNHAGLYRPISYVPTWTQITGKPSFAVIATTGKYSDLIGAPSLSGYELLTNKSTNTSLGTSNSLYPTQNAVKAYVDDKIAMIGGGGSAGGVTSLTGSNNINVSSATGNVTVSLSNDVSITGTLGAGNVNATSGYIGSFNATTANTTNLQSNGYVKSKIKVVSGSYTVGDDDYGMAMLSGSSYTLPAASNVTTGTSRHLFFKNSSSGTTQLIYPASGQYINDGYATYGSGGMPLYPGETVEMFEQSGSFQTMRSSGALFQGVVTGTGGTNKYFQYKVGNNTYYLPAFASLPN